MLNTDASLSLLDIDIDVLKLIIQESARKCRIVCKRFKTIVQHIPQISIMLSKRGSEEATVDFFSSFSLPIIGSTHDWHFDSGWIPAVMESLREGMKINSLVISTSDENLQLLISGLKSSLLRSSGTVHYLQLHFEGSFSTLQSCAESLKDLSDLISIELKTRIVYDLNGLTGRMMMTHLLNALASSAQLKGMDLRQKPYVLLLHLEIYDTIMPAAVTAWGLRMVLQQQRP